MVDSLFHHLALRIDDVVWQLAREVVHALNNFVGIEADVLGHPSPRADLNSTLLDYVRFQSRRQLLPSASTINDRVACADRAIRNGFPEAPCQSAHEFQQVYLHRKPLGLERPRFELRRLRVREPKIPRGSHCFGALMILGTMNVIFASNGMRTCSNFADPIAVLQLV
jgi:hypothetical protein